jgi:hypothetical protein
VTDEADALNNPGCAESGTGTCSLRDAITFANSNPGPDEIHFAIPGAGVHTITLNSDLPGLEASFSATATIDGYAQPGSSANTNGAGLGDNSVHLIEINGNGHRCFSMEGGPIVVRGLTVNRCAGYAIDFNPGPDEELLVHGSVEGNFVGTDPTGTIAVGNGEGGVMIRGGCDVTVGADVFATVPQAASARNLISGNPHGIDIVGGVNVRVAGNLVGTTSAGTSALPNQTGIGVLDTSGYSGISCGGSVGLPIIGGPLLTLRNVISGNTAYGIYTQEATETIIEGNFVGTDVSGTQRLPNFLGIYIVQDAVIGGSAIGARNLISGNESHGILVSAGRADILGNFIGTDISGTDPLGNGGTGIRSEIGFLANRVISGNVIAFNGARDPVGGGIALDNLADSNGYSILGNSIFANTSDGSIPGRGIGIDLMPSFDADGPTPNDDCDADGGANNLQNFPVLTSAVASGSTTRLVGTLNSVASQTYHLEFFANPACDPTGYGEGMTLIGSADLFVGDSCNAIFDVTISLSLDAGVFVTSTATRIPETTGTPAGHSPARPRDFFPPGTDTSEFSACVAVTRAPIEVASVSPTSGLAIGASITIGGEGFETGAVVRVGGSLASNATTSSPAQIEATTPSLAAGRLYDVVVTNPDSSAATLADGWMADFEDVPQDHLFHKAIESIFRDRITVGCDVGLYCPDDQVTRAQMAIFLARWKAGGSANLPASGTVDGKPYDCVNGGTSIFTDVTPTDVSCRSVHYIAAQNITSGCYATEFCPALTVGRDEMAAFVARALVAPAGGSGVPLVYGPDPDTGFAYSCDLSSPDLYFTDIGIDHPFCKHIHLLWAKGIVSGCGDGQYCHLTDVTRGQMAKFLANAMAEDD